MEKQDIKDMIEFTTGAEAVETPNPEVQIPSEWDLYITIIEQDRALILLDLSLAQNPEIMKYGYLLGVQVAIQNPTEDGFYTDEEQPMLFAIEDRVEAIFTTEAPCKFVATVTTGGARMIYFYAKDDNYLPSLVGKVAAEYPDYTFNYLIEQDKNWDFYFDVLYPSQMEMQLMKNRHMVEQMEKMGEDLDSDTEVNHWFFFTNGASRRQAAVQLMSKGYEILDDNFYEEKIEEYPYGLRVMIKHPLNLEALSEKTYELYEFIEAYDGVYDGWGLMADGDPETWL